MGFQFSPLHFKKILKKITADWISVKIDRNIPNTCENTLINPLLSKTYNLINPLTIQAIQIALVLALDER
jgi:hypothetical protein